MNNSQDTGSSKDKATKLGCRFTPAEVKLLDLLSRTEGISLSAYFRQAAKKQMMDDMLKHAGHHSSVRSESNVKAAHTALEEIIKNVEAADHEE